MVANLAIEPVSPGSANLMEFRHRPAMGERTVLQDSTQKAPAGSRAGDRDKGLAGERRPANDDQPVQPGVRLMMRPRTSGTTYGRETRIWNFTISSKSVRFFSVL